MTVYFGVNVGCWLGGTAYYWEVAIDEVSLVPTSTGISCEKAEVADNFQLHRNYPNPFNPTTTISYSLLRDATISLSIFDLKGQLVRTLIQNQPRSAGDHEILFDAASLSSGCYICRLSASGLTRTRRLMLVK